METTSEPGYYLIEQKVMVLAPEKKGYQQVYLPVYNKYIITLISKNLGYKSCTWDEVFQYKWLQRKCWARSCLHRVFVFLKSKRLAWGFNKSCSHRWAQVIIALYYTPLCMQISVKKPHAKTLMRWINALNTTPGLTLPQWKRKITNITFERTGFVPIEVIEEFCNLVIFQTRLYKEWEDLYYLSVCISAERRWQLG